MTQEKLFYFRVCQDDVGFFFIEEKKGFFNTWHVVHEPYTIEARHFLTYEQTVHWIEHEVSRRTGVQIENCTR